MRFTHPTGTIIELSDADAKKLYSVATLAKRLGMSERGAYELIRGGHIDYCCAGTKNYRITELAAICFTLGLRPVAA